MDNNHTRNIAFSAPKAKSAHSSHRRVATAPTFFLGGKNYLNLEGGHSCIVVVKAPTYCMEGREEGDKDGGWAHAFLEG